MSNRLAIMIQSGFGAATNPCNGHGAYLMSDKLYDLYPDRREVFFAVRPQDADLSCDVEFILNRFGAEVIAHWGHSFGAGRGQKNFGLLLEEKGRMLDLAICVDPVPVDEPHFLQTEKPFFPPVNTVSVLGFRTLNQPPFSPWGRRIQHQTAAHRQVTFGANVDEFDDHVFRAIRDSKVTHATIDEHPEVLRESLAAIERLREL